jgi:lipoprotein NlpI
VVNKSKTGQWGWIPRFLLTKINLKPEINQIKQNSTTSYAYAKMSGLQAFHMANMLQQGHTKSVKSVNSPKNSPKNDKVKVK